MAGVAVGPGCFPGNRGRMRVLRPSGEVLATQALLAKYKADGPSGAGGEL